MHSPEKYIAANGLNCTIVTVPSVTERKGHLKIFARFLDIYSKTQSLSYESAKDGLAALAVRSLFEDLFDLEQRDITQLEARLWEKVKYENMRPVLSELRNLSLDSHRSFETCQQVFKRYLESICVLGSVQS